MGMASLSDPNKRASNFERWLYIVVGLIVCILFIGILLAIFKDRVSNTLNHDAKLSASPVYVDNTSCLQCHQPEAKAWAISHHALAMADANESSVLAHFDHTQIKHDGITAEFFKRNQRFYVRTQGADSKISDFEIKYTFGVDPIQQYLIELPNHNLQNFTIAWDVNHQQWFDLYPHEKTPPGDVLHWAGRYQNANVMCVSCHTTNFKKNYNENLNSYTSTWSQMNVSCQACHGPGEHHLEWVKAYKTGKIQSDRAGENKGLLVNFKQNGVNTIIETCGICHSRRSELTTHSGVGEPLLDNYLPVLLNAGIYYPDGQQQAEVYVYHSFLQSKMYQMGVSCIDCHNPHTGKLKYDGNAVCTQCHSPIGQKRFPTAAKLYDDPMHTFHQKGTKGAECVSCHMPSKNYMMIHARPDHSIRIPRPDLSIKLGTPNACNNCHSDKSAEWAADWISKWYGLKQHTEIHYGEIIAAGRLGKPEAEAALMKLASDKSKPNVVRATALNLLINYGAQSLSASIEALQDKDPAIRREAISGFEKIPATERIVYVAPFLNDPIRAVRIEAARVLSPVPLHAFSESQQYAFKDAINEYIAAMKVMIDLPPANFNLAMLNENTKQFTQAEKFYLNALRIDPDFTPARLNLARMYNGMNRNDDAIRILQEGINSHSIGSAAQGELYYSLGLILAEKNNLNDAVAALSKAVKLLPDHTRIRYNYALALQLLGKHKEAESEFLILQQTASHN